MADKIPGSITRQHILTAIAGLDSGNSHAFGDSTGYDVLHDGRRYAPKAVIGLAAAEVLGAAFGPYDFKGGLKSRCFRMLLENGSTIVTKGDTNPFPDEVNATQSHTEGTVQQVLVNPLRARCRSEGKINRSLRLGLPSLCIRLQDCVRSHR